MKKSTIIILTAISLLSLATAIYGLMSRDTYAYFEYDDVYNETSLKKKLEKDLEKVVAVRKSQLDSMQLELSFIAERIQNGTEKDPLVLRKFEDDKARYMTYQSQFEEENARLKDTYFNQIRKDINDKAILYAKEKGYTFLFSAMGDGALMYADESKNVTEDFLDYINK